MYGSDLGNSYLQQSLTGRKGRNMSIGIGLLAAVTVLLLVRRSEKGMDQEEGGGVRGSDRNGEYGAGLFLRESVRQVRKRSVI